MNPKLVALLVVLGFATFIAGDSLFIVDQRETVVIRQFGQFKREIAEPGLYAKIPFMQEAVRFDKRVLALDAPAQEFLVSQLQVVIDPFARYQIVNAREFLRTVGNEETLRSRLEPTMTAAVRDVVSGYRLTDILSDRREQIMEEIRDKVDEDVQKAGYGIKIIDVRIRRADFPDQISQSVFGRMKTDRQRVASEIRGKGNSESQRIKAQVDADRVTLLAETQRAAQTLRGEGDNESIRVLAEATSRDPSFYNFYRSMQAYRTALTPETTTMVLSPKSDFLRFFNEAAPAAGK